MTEQDGLKEAVLTPSQVVENTNKEESMLNIALNIGESKFRQRRRKK